MIYYMYCILDKRIDRFNAPVFKTEDPDQVAEMARAGYLTQDPSRREVALDLYEVGTFDSKTGQTDILPSMRLVASNAVFEEECKHVLQEQPS